MFAIPSIARVRFTRLARQTGEVSISEAAEILGCHRDTVLRWVQETVSGRPGKIQAVRRDIVGRYWLRREEVAQLRRMSDEGLLRDFS